MQPVQFVLSFLEEDYTCKIQTVIHFNTHTHAHARKGSGLDIHCQLWLLSGVSHCIVGQAEVGRLVRREIDDRSIDSCFLYITRRDPGMPFPPREFENRRLHFQQGCHLVYLILAAISIWCA